MKQYTILTKNGLNKLVSAAANQTTITLKEMAVGDGNGEINQDATALQNERHRFAINAITINQNDNNILEVEGVLQADIGGFYVREVGIFCNDGSLFAIAKVAESYKPLLAEGSAKDITISFQIQISNTSLINLKVDNNVVLATRKWVIDTFLPINGKASDSDKLDGLDSSAFLKTQDFNLEKTALTLNTTNSRVEIDLSKARYFKITLDKAITIDAVNEPTNEICVYFIELINAGNYSITWQDTIKWNKNKPPTFQVNKRDIIGFLKTDVLFGFVVGKDMLP